MSTLSAADKILHDACREVVAAIRLGRRINRTIPTATIALSLRVAAEDAEEAMRG